MAPLPFRFLQLSAFAKSQLLPHPLVTARGFLARGTREMLCKEQSWANEWGKEQAHHRVTQRATFEDEVTLLYFLIHPFILSGNNYCIHRAGRWFKPKYQTQ